MVTSLQTDLNDNHETSAEDANAIDGSQLVLNGGVKGIVYIRWGFSILVFSFYLNFFFFLNC